MLYRKMNKTGEDLSVLGFGCMRFPKTDDGKIEEKEATEMLHYAIDNGVNYIDTAYPYHNGDSEPFVGKALKGGYREKVKLATKLPSWLIKEKSDFDKYLNEQLERLQTDHIDFYLIHALNNRFWPNLIEKELSAFIDKALKDGRIKYAGFSFHDSTKLFKEIVDYYDWDFCQIQYNYLDEENQAGREGLQYAADKGLGIIIMEPLRGGKIANKVPEPIMNIWNEAPVKRSPAEWALKWVWNHPQVNVVLSGMSTMEQVKENVKLSDEAKAKSLTEQELKLIDRVKTEYNSRLKVNCTNCNYCMPCPNGVPIPSHFSLYNDAFMFDDVEESKSMYDKHLKDKAECIECGECETKCPQNIPIIQELKNVKNFFEKTAS
jgi:uncharacterized protein